MILINTIQIMDILPAGLIMLALGLTFAIVLLIANEKFKVAVDEKIEQIHQALPKIDCGACGFAGCGSYAKAVAANAELIGKCAPGGPATSEKIGAILNLHISDAGPAKRPIVHCGAHTDNKTYRAIYEGIKTCLAANALANVQACKYGCLSFGDCTAACKFDALHIVDGLATVNYEKCTGCGACAKACPRNLIDMVPFNHEIMITVACRSSEAGKDTRAMCTVGCIACGLCAKQSDIFTVTDNFAKIDYTRYEPTTAVETAINKCPTCTIVYRGKNAPAPRQPKEKTASSA